MREVLLLNSTFEPHDVIDPYRALRLVFRGKAEVLQYDQGELRSIHSSVRIPAVIRIYRYIRFKRNPIRFSRANVLRRDNHKCQYCGMFMNANSKKLTWDHIVPRARGGDSSWENCVACCIKCNSKKGDKTLAEMGWNLLKEPRTPHPFQFAKRYKFREDWQQWMFI